MTNRNVVKGVCTAVAGFFLLVSSNGHADTTKPSSRSAREPSGTRLADAARSALRAKFVARVNPAALAGSPFYKFSTTPTQASGVLGPVMCGDNTTQIVLLVTNTGASAAGTSTTGASVHFEAVNPMTQQMIPGGAGMIRPATTDPGGTHKITGTFQPPTPPHPAYQSFPFLPIFVAWLEGLPNDGMVAFFEPDFAQTITATTIPAASGPMLGFVAGGESSLQGGGVLQSCFKVKNAGGASSSNATIKVVLRKGVGYSSATDIATATATLAPIANGAETEVCMTMPTIPGGPSWTSLMCKKSQTDRYGFTVSIVGAPNNGAQIHMPAYQYKYRLGTL